MYEYELRFKIKNPKAFEKSLKAKGYSKWKEYEMCDLIFENQHPMLGRMRSGYLILRIRMMEGKEPYLESKKYIADTKWEEVVYKAKVNLELLRLLEYVMYPSRIIKKFRKEYRRANLLVTVDKVKDLGNFVEIEGSEREAHSAAKELGFKMSENQKNYGTLLWKKILTNEIKLPTNDQITNELSNFSKKR